jgi:DNA-directed RNA polymerase subunit RPC12/RpoP
VESKGIAIVCGKCKYRFSRRAEAILDPEDIACPSCGYLPSFKRIPVKAVGENRDDYAVRLEAFIARILK